MYTQDAPDQDTADQKYQDMRFQGPSPCPTGPLSIPPISCRKSFAMPKETLDAYMKADNGISHFRRALEMVLEQREHTLSGEMDELLGPVL